MENEIVEKIKQTVNLKDVIERYLDLFKDGSYYKCHCPFHEDGDPSLKFKKGTNFWKCYSCGRAGDAIHFVEEYKHLSYVQALEEIAGIYNIDTVSYYKPKRLSEDERKAINAKKRMAYAANCLADEFSQYLYSGNCEDIIEYLEKARGFSSDTIQAFRLGYASKDSDLHIKNLRKSGYNSDDLRNIKVLYTNKENEDFIAFANRVIFPLVDDKGDVVSFAGRTLNSKSDCKYRNGANSDIYIKSNLLYGLYQAQDFIRQSGSVYIVEGYCDVISMYQKGIKNVVASCGTALAKGQIALLKKYVPMVEGKRSVTIMYDADKAGYDANIKNGKLLMKAGFDVRVVLLPDNEDPDSFCKSHTSVEVNSYLNSHSQLFLKLLTEVALQSGSKEYEEELNIIFGFLERIENN